MQKTALVLGGEGLIGYNLVKRLKIENYWVRSVDMFRRHKYIADHFVMADLKDPKNVENIFTYPKILNNPMGSFDEVYCLASDTELVNFNSERLINSCSITINVARQALNSSIKSIFFASGKNIHYIFDDFINEQSVDSYLFEKKFGEFLYYNIRKDYNLNTKIGVLDNIFGPQCIYEHCEESLITNISHKIAKAKNESAIELIVDSDYMVSVLFIDDCIDAIRLLMNNNETDQAEIASNKKILISDLVNSIVKISNKNLTVNYKNGIKKIEKSNIDEDIFVKLKLTYDWINNQINRVS